MTTFFVMTTSLNRFAFVYTLLSQCHVFPHGKFGSLSPKKAKCNRVALPNPNSYTSSNYKVYAGSGSCFHKPLETLTWTTGSLTCARDHSYAWCIHTGAVGQTDSESAQLFDSEKLKVFLVLLTGFEPSIFGSPVQPL